MISFMKSFLSPFYVRKFPGSERSSEIKCNNHFMATAKEKCKTNILSESILSMDTGVSFSTSNRTGAWFSVDLPL